MIKNIKIDTLVKSLLLLVAPCIVVSLSSCAYTETMNQREAEGQRLSKDLNYEIERGNKLSRKY